MAIEVMLVGGTQLYRDFFRVYVNQHRDLDLVGDGPRPLDALKLLVGRRADVLLVETEGAEDEVREVVAALGASHPDQRVLFVGSPGDETAHRPIGSSTTAFVARDERATNLLGAIRALGRPGETSASIEASLAAGGEAMAAVARESDGRFASLTPRESEVFGLLARGDDNEAISIRLGISVRTVETHRSRVLTKLRARNLGDLVRFASRRGPI